jgi:hypothetical protein
MLSGALGVYFFFDGPLWWLVALGLAPDLSMLGYLAGPRLGSHGYNLFHTYTLPLALGGVGLWMDVPVAILIAAIWIGHIGADRLFGYGLKFESGFKDTHLDTQPAPTEMLTRSE